jgi:hypothetical protein
MPSPTSKAPDVVMARIAILTSDDATGDAITVHFNPASLQLQVSNELKDTKNNERKQYVAKASAKLTMELPFDTTDTGEDVTLITRKLQAFLVPPASPASRAKQPPPPPIVLFEWGTMRFKGIAENYRETIDYFSASGVPLRASVNLTLSRQDQVFDESSDSGATPGAAGGDDSFALDTPAGGAAAAAHGLRAPGAARALAAANGEENLRFGAGASLSVSANVTLRPALAFSAGGGGVSLAAGSSAGIALSASPAKGGGRSGAGLAATARLSATEGAFSGLRTTASTPRTAARIDPSRILPRVESASRVTETNARFQIGGKATVRGAGGLRADVGSSGKLSFHGG